MMGKKFVLVCLCLIALPGVKGGRARRVPVPVECRNLDDCNNLWRHGEAYSCSEGKCTCHLQAVFDSVNKSCRCKPGYIKVGNACLGAPPVPAALPVPVNGTSRASCTPTSCPGNAQCISNECVCNEDYVMVGSACETVANSVGDSCQYNEQCRKKLGGFSECSGTRCVCQSNGVAVSNNAFCYAKKVLGDECTYIEQCNHVQHGTCTKNVCLCDPGFVEFDKTCIPVVNTYNDECTENVQCQNGKLGYGSTCNADTKTCLCELEFFYQSSLKECLYAKGLDDSCDGKNNDCFLPADGDKQNIQCKNSVCMCKKGFVPSEDKKRCENSGVVHKMSFSVMGVLLLMYATRW